MYQAIRFSELSKELQAEKLKRDSEYEIAVQNIYADKSLTPKQKQAQKAALYQKYEDWAKVNVWREVTDDDLLIQEESNLAEQVISVNELRAKLGKKPVEVVEKIQEVK